MKPNNEFYSMEAVSLQGKVIPMESFRGKVVLAVNTASKCGFTPQYAGLEQLYRKHKDRGLVVLGFPSNQFAGQEPGGRSEIEQTCYINYGVSFPVFEKIKVNGRDTHPVFAYLKEALPGTLGKRIPWNFTKFLIDRSGKPVKRYAPKTKPEDLEEDIIRLLEEGEGHS